MRYKKFLLGICLIACVFFSVACVVASDVNETAIANEDNQDIMGETNDEIINTGAEAEILGRDDGTFTALKNKINNAPSGSTITLENDYTYNPGSDDDEIKIDKSLTIDGKGHTIDGNSKASGFSLASNNIVLKNIKFTNCNNYVGGAIYVYETYNHFTINSCTFTNCKAYSGGAIYARDVSNIDIINSIFDSNGVKSSTGNGGAIWLTADNVNIENNVFINNIANKGGAIYLSSFSEHRLVQTWVPGHEELNYAITVYDYANGQLVGSHHPTHWVDGHYEKSYVDRYVGSNVKINNNIFNRNSKNYTGSAIIDNGTNTKMNNNTNTNIAHSTIYVHSKDTSITNNKFIWEMPKPQSGSKKTGNGASSVKSADALKTIKIVTPKKAFKLKVKTKKYTVKVKSNNKPVKNLKLTLKFKGKTYKAKTNKKGKATFKITNLKKKGTFKAKLIYKDKFTHKKVTKIVKIKCK